jgi:hypothetical protein
MKTNRRAFSNGRYHTRERYERLRTVPRCTVCAQHTDVCCSGCRKPICMRHKRSLDGVKLFCRECSPDTTTARVPGSLLHNHRGSGGTGSGARTHSAGSSPPQGGKPR